MRASHRTTASFGHPPVPAWVPPWATGGSLLSHGPQWGQSASPWSSSPAAGESLLRHLSSSFPSFCTDLGLQGWFSHILTPVYHSYCIGIFPFLINVITELLSPSLMALAGLFWSQLAFALLDMGEPSGRFSQKPPLQPPCYHNISTQTQYNCSQICVIQNFCHKLLNLCFEGL